MEYVLLQTHFFIFYKKWEIFDFCSMSYGAIMAIILNVLLQKEEKA